MKSQCTCVVTGIDGAAAASQSISFPPLFNRIILTDKSVSVFEASLWSLRGSASNEQLTGKTAAMQVGENTKLLICNANMK